MTGKYYLVTGAAGFIGYHLCNRLLSLGIKTIGFDNLNDYYDVNLKKSRLAFLQRYAESIKGKWNFTKCDLKNKKLLDETFRNNSPLVVIHLAAQAGVRYSLKNPDAYVESNLIGFNNIIECCRKFSLNHFIFASSSSVYGGNKKVPFNENDNIDHPVSLYAATKKSNELVAHSYSHLFKIPSTGLRFFTVYGPWGRPDMSPMIFTESIISRKPIKIFNFGKMWRDFTYIDDVIESITRLIHKPPLEKMEYDFISPKASQSWAPYQVFNIGNNSVIPLMEFINTLEEILGIEAIKEFLPMQEGDVVKTYADTSLIEEYTSYKPKICIKQGLKLFIDWYREYHEIF